jgi:uridine monophosphate synthetase
VITTGGAKLEAIAPLREAGLLVEDILVVVDREQAGAQTLANAGLRLHSVLRVREVLAHLANAGAITAGDREKAEAFLRSSRRVGGDVIWAIDRTPLPVHWCHAKPCV